MTCLDRARHECVGLNFLGRYLSCTRPFSAHAFTRRELFSKERWVTASPLRRFGLSSSRLHVCGRRLHDVSATCVQETSPRRVQATSPARVLGTFPRHVSEKCLHDVIVWTELDMLGSSSARMDRFSFSPIFVLCLFFLHPCLPSPRTLLERRDG